MNKKVIAAVLIAVMGALTLSIGLHSVLAQGPSGADNPYPQQVWFCECWHDNLNTQDDTMSGLGVTANYDTVNKIVAFNYGDWIFEDEAGYSSSSTPNSPVKMETPMQCISCVNYGQSNQQYCTYYDYATPTWGVPSWANHDCWYVSLNDGGSLSDVHSVEGETGAQFYYISNPSQTWWIYVYTQNPLNQGPGSFAFLTANGQA